MKCVEQGLITLDEDVTPYLPELAKQPVYVPPSSLPSPSSLPPRPFYLPLVHPYLTFPRNPCMYSVSKLSDGRTTSTPRTAPITLRHLLTMTAGTGYPGFNVAPEVARGMATSREPYLFAEKVSTRTK